MVQKTFTEDFYKNRWHGSGTSNLYPSVYLAGGQNQDQIHFM
jgi:hypothetical protein